MKNNKEKENDTNVSEGAPGLSMSFFEHLEELRARLLVSLFFGAFFSAAGWYFSTQIISYFKAFPYLQNVKLIMIRPTEAFYVRMKIAVFAGFIAAIPIIIYELTAFVLPGLYKKERKWVLRLILMSVILFYIGVAFALFIMLPFTMNFFIVQMTQGIAVPQISLEEYVNYLTAITLMGGLVFQTPIVLFFLTLAGILSSEKLRRGRRIAVIIILIAAAVVTPPDAFSQIITAVPIFLLYELCIWLSKAAGK